MPARTTRRLAVVFAALLLVLAITGAVSADSVKRGMEPRWIPAESYGVVYADADGNPEPNPDLIWWETTRHKQVWFSVAPTGYNFIPGNTQYALWDGQIDHGFASDLGFTIPAGYNVNYVLQIQTTWAAFRPDLRTNPGSFYVSYRIP